MADTAEFLPIPCYDISDASRRTEAMGRFLELGTTLPMIAVHFEDIGILSSLDAMHDGFRGAIQYTQISREQSNVFDMLATQAFEYFGETPQRLLARGDAEPFLFSVGRSPLGAVLRYANEKRLVGHSKGSASLTDMGAHADTTREGRDGDGTVYGAHLTTYGQGGADAGTGGAEAFGAEGKLRFPHARPLTHSRKLTKGDLHIFVRVAPSTSTYDAEGGIIRPTTHDFYTESEAGRVHIESSFGLTSQWQFKPKQLAS